MGNSMVEGGKHDDGVPGGNEVKRDLVVVSG